MNRLSTSNSDPLHLNARQWIVVIMLYACICLLIDRAWLGWEQFNAGTDYRLPCFGERMSDYWEFRRWTSRARDQYRVYLIGDSVIWGQETTHNQTISHYLNERYGQDIFANMGMDGLHHAAMRGLVKIHGQSLNEKLVLLQFNPFWMSDSNYDLRGTWKDYYHPRLIPQFNRRIAYHDRDTQQRIAVLAERRIPIFSLVRHVMVNSFHNQSIQQWMIQNPYSCPFTAVTFESAPLWTKAPGPGRSWQDKGMRPQNFAWLAASDSLQWECFQDTIRSLQKRNAQVFVLVGPYNAYMLTDDSRDRLNQLLSQTVQWLGANNVPYFDVGDNLLPSETYADEVGHLTAAGHAILAEALLKQDNFRKWIELQPPP